MLLAHFITEFGAIRGCTFGYFRVLSHSPSTMQVLEQAAQQKSGGHTPCLDVVSPISSRDHIY